MLWLPLSAPQKLPGIIGSGRRLQRFMIAHWWILSFVLPLFIVNTTTQKKSSFAHLWISRVRYIFHYNDDLNTSRIAGGCSEDCRLAYQPAWYHIKLRQARIAPSHQSTQHRPRPRSFWKSILSFKPRAKLKRMVAPDFAWVRLGGTSLAVNADLKEY